MIYCSSKPEYRVYIYLKSLKRFQAASNSGAKSYLQPYKVQNASHLGSEIETITKIYLCRYMDTRICPFTPQHHTHLAKHAYDLFGTTALKYSSNMSVWCQRYVKCVTKRICGL